MGLRRTLPEVYVQDSLYLLNGIYQLGLVKDPAISDLSQV